MTDFDHHVDRRGSGSLKWELYPEGVLPLWVADMDFVSPSPVVEALRRRAGHGVFGYVRTPHEPLVDAVRAYLSAHFGWEIETAWLVWLPSVVTGLTLCSRAFAAPGEGVMTVTPVYPPFLMAGATHGRRLVTVPARQVREPGHIDRWELPLDEMEAAVTPGTRVLLFCHPHNPLGRVWRRDEVVAVAEFCRRHDLILCSDEVHCDLRLDALEHVPSSTLGDDAASRTVTLLSPSKTFNLPGLDLAFAVVPDARVRKRLRAEAEGLLPSPGAFAVDAATVAYRDGWTWVDELLDYLRGSRDALERFVCDELPRVSVTHVEATYLAWLDVRELGLEDPFTACLKAGVALNDGADFGAPGFVRLNLGCPRAVLDEALSRLKAVLK